MRIRLPSFGERENAILRALGSDFTIVRGTVADFRELVDAVASKDAEGTARRLQKVLEDEKAADDFQRKLSTEIAEGAFFGGVREDMLNLLEKIDNIADSAKGAARIIAAGETLDDFAISLLGSDQMKAFVAEIAATVDSLGGVLEAFGIGKKEILRRATVVEELEEAADGLKDEVSKQLFAKEHRPDAVTVIQMRDFLLVADSIADNAEDATDVVLILVAKGYG